VKCENLDVWQNAVDLSVEVYVYFSNSREFGFKDQITRSCLSISSNIAEGMEKDSQKEKVRFINIAKGSAAEFITQTIIGQRATFISSESANGWIKRTKLILSMLTHLQTYLRSKQ